MLGGATMAEIVILTGAGISADSGVATFRGADGLWEKHRLEDVATPEAFARNPALVHDFYNARRRQMAEVEPNAAHHALARLEAAMPGELLLVTQNIDDLHERAGSKTLIHMHGALFRARCAICEHEIERREDLNVELHCQGCKTAGGMRPAVVWFGEIPLQMPRIIRALQSCALFVSIGTSGQVYPAAGFVEEAQAAGAETLELNLERTSRCFAAARLGRAAEIVPSWVDEVIATRRGA